MLGGYEEPHIGDNVSLAEHSMIMRANEEHLPWDAFKRVLSELFVAVENDDYVRVRQLLRKTVNGYTPEEEIVDWIHQQRRIEPNSSRH